ncbi:MAG: hypothetical protein QXT00_02345 [Ignisphaera sp.]
MDANALARAVAHRLEGEIKKVLPSLCANNLFHDVFVYEHTDGFNIACTYMVLFVDLSIGVDIYLTQRDGGYDARAHATFRFTCSEGKINSVSVSKQDITDYEESDGWYTVMDEDDLVDIALRVVKPLCARNMHIIQYANAIVFVRSYNPVRYWAERAVDYMPRDAVEQHIVALLESALERSHPITVRSVSVTPSSGPLRFYEIKVFFTHNKTHTPGILTYKVSYQASALLLPPADSIPARIYYTLQLPKISVEVGGKETARAVELQPPIGFTAHISLDDDIAKKEGDLIQSLGVALVGALRAALTRAM